MNKRNKYEQEFKEQIAQLYLQTEKSQSTIAKEFGISVSLVGKWVNAYKDKYPELDHRRPGEDELSYLKSNSKK